MAENSLNIWVIIFSIGAAQGIFVSIVLLFHKKGNVAANRVLAIIILMISIILVENSLRLAGFYQKWPFLIATGTPMWYVFSPLFYLYVKILLGEKPRWRWSSIVHLIPVLYVMYFMSFFYSWSGERKLAYLAQKAQAAEMSTLSITFGFAYFIPFFIYLTAIIIKIRNYEKSYKLINSATLLTRLASFKILFIIFTGYLTYDVISFSYRLITGEALIGIANLFLALNSVFIYAFAYTALQNGEKPFPYLSHENTKYKTSSLSPDDSRNLLSQLQKHMEAKKPYLSMDLKLSDLAEQVGISVHHLSQILNQQLQSNFYDYINRHRVQEIQQRLADPQNNAYTILAIALDVGFSSKASFNRAFKKYTGITPSDFLKSQNTLSIEMN